MTAFREVRADFDADTLTVYQAYSPAIAGPAVDAGTFVPPFKPDRMTWIKSSFLWMMYRCGWATKPGQERVLAIRITRAGFDDNLHLQPLEYRSLQLGLSPAFARRYVADWITELRDITDQVREVHALVSSGDLAAATAALPTETRLPAVARRSGCRRRHRVVRNGSKKPLPSHQNPRLAV